MVESLQHQKAPQSRWMFQKKKSIRNTWLHGCSQLCFHPRTQQAVRSPMSTNAEDWNGPGHDSTLISPNGFNDG